MTSRIPATIAACAVLALGAAPQVRADGGAALATPAPLVAASQASVLPLLPEPDEAGTCRVDDDPAARLAPLDTAGKIAEIRALLAAQADGAPGGGFVPLDNRGYNYGSNATIDPGALRFEAGRLAR